MSQSITIHLAGAFEEAQLVHALGHVLGHELMQDRSVEWQLWKTHVLCLQVSLFQSEGFDDDSQIPLTRFSHVIDIGLRSSTLPADVVLQLQEHAARVIAEMCAQEIGCDWIIMRGLQKILAKSPGAPSS